MKNTKKIIALAMAAVMLILPCIPADAATVSMSRTTGHTVVTGVDYTKYSVYGSQSGHTETACVLEFNPADGYIPMAFASNAGNVTTLQTQYSTAVNKYGYEVAGVINGSYFDTVNGTLSGMLISGGKICCADIGGTIGNKTSVVAFGYDGSMNIVDTQLSYKMYFNGDLIPDALRFFNKQQGVDDYALGVGKIFYYDTSCGNYADSITGYEVICKKLNGTDLAVGETMVGEVVSIKSNTSGSAIASDEFVLSTASGASYETYLKSLSVGDKVEIAVEETVAASASIMENAASVITNVGWLVKDGVDLTLTTSTIGEHSVTSTYAYWTAFGQKADGTYVFFTSSGGATGNTAKSLTLRDVAAAMIQLGCVNVIRMDGGGSTAMYVSNTGIGGAGYVMNAENRSVADCILIVKNTATNKPDLKTAIKAADKISYTDYTPDSLVAIRAAYEEAKDVYYNANSTNDDYKAAAAKLNALLANAGPSSMANGEQFWVTHYNTLNNQGSGAIMTETYTGGAWWLNVAFSPVAGTNAYEITAISNGLSNGSGAALAIPEGGFVYALNLGNSPYNSAAVTAMCNRASKWSVGDQFIFSGLDITGQTVPTSTPTVDWYDASYNCTAKIATYDPNAVDDRVSNGIYITGFNTSINTGDATIFTSDFNGNGLITVATANHNWTQNVVLKWDASVGAYVVTSTSHGGGAAADIQLSKGEILIAIHNGGGTSATNIALLQEAKVGQVMNLYAIDIDSREFGVAPYLTITDRVDAPIYYQMKGNDLRLIGYVDDFEEYEKVTFTLTINGKVSTALECTTAYSGLYANEKLYTTEDIYGVDGYFVAYTINNYLDANKGYSGKEVTFSATYTTVTGEEITDERTLTISK